MARDLIAVMDDDVVDLALIELDVVIEVPEAAATLWRHATDVERLHAFPYFPHSR